MNSPIHLEECSRQEHIRRRKQHRGSRLPRACDACNTKRRACSNDRPCESCRDRSIACTDKRPKVKRGGKRGAKGGITLNIDALTSRRSEDAELLPHPFPNIDQEDPVQDYVDGSEYAHSIEINCNLTGFSSNVAPEEQLYYPHQQYYEQRLAELERRNEEQRKIIFTLQYGLGDLVRKAIELENLTNLEGNPGELQRNGRSDTNIEESEAMVGEVKRFEANGGMYMDKDGEDVLAGFELH